MFSLPLRTVEWVDAPALMSGTSEIEFNELQVQCPVCDLATTHCGGIYAWSVANGHWICKRRIYLHEGVLTSTACFADSAPSFNYAPTGEATVADQESKPVSDQASNNRPAYC